MKIFSVSFRIAVSIIIAGIFIIAVFIALNYEMLNLSFYIVFAFIAFYIFFFGFAIGQKFAIPVKKLLKKATDLSEGDLTSRIYLETKDEFSELAKVFNKIANELEESRLKTEMTKKSVDMKVKAKTQALEEIINALEQKVRNRTLELQRIINESETMQERTKTQEMETEKLRKELNGLKEVLNQCQVGKRVLDKKK